MIIKFVFITLFGLLMLIEESVTKDADWMFQSESQWDSQWKKGNWNYMDKVPVERSKLAVVAELVKLYGSNSTDYGLLDVGCGEGTIMDFLDTRKRKNYVGIDLSIEAVKAGRAKRPEGRFIHAAAHTFSPKRKGHKFSTIIFSDVLYYIDHEGTLNRYNNEILSHDGIVIISIFQKPENNQIMYENIFQSARSIFDKVDEMHLSGTTVKTAHGSGAVVAQTGFWIEVYKKKGNTGGGGA